MSLVIIGRKYIRAYISNYRIWINDYLLFFDPRSTALVPKILLRKYEKFQTKLLKRSIQKDWVVVDIGGHIGYYTLLLSHLAKKVYSFEPTPYTFKILRKNIKDVHKRKNVVLVNAAVVNKNGYRNFYVSEVFGADNTLGQRIGEIRKVFKVKTVKLDSFFLKKESKIDFIKVDAQGFEPYIFDGMKDILKKNKNILIMCEFWDKGIKNAGRDPVKFLKFVKELKFKIYVIDEQNEKVLGPLSISEALDISNTVTDFIFSRAKLSWQ